MIIHVHCRVYDIDPNISTRELVTDSDSSVLGPNFTNLHANEEVSRLIAGSYRLRSHEHAVLQDRVLLRAAIKGRRPHWKPESAIAQESMLPQRQT